MFDNARRLLANRSTFTFIGLSDVLGQTSLASSYRMLIAWLLGVTAQTEIQTSVAWAKLNTN